MNQSGVRTNLTVMVAWCGDQQKGDIFELQTEEDFDNCENFPLHPVSFPSQNSVDGFIVAPPDQTSGSVLRSHWSSSNEARLSLVEL